MNTHEKSVLTIFNYFLLFSKIYLVNKNWNGRKDNNYILCLVFMIIIHMLQWDAKYIGFLNVAIITVCNILAKCKYVYFEYFWQKNWNNNWTLSVQMSCITVLDKLLEIVVRWLTEIFRNEFSIWRLNCSIYFFYFVALFSNFEYKYYKYNIWFLFVISHYFLIVHAVWLHCILSFTDESEFILTQVGLTRAEPPHGAEWG